MGKTHQHLANKHTKSLKFDAPDRRRAGNLPLLRSLERNLATAKEPELRARLTTVIAGLKVRP
jgi:hypothetical protein